MNDRSTRSLHHGHVGDGTYDSLHKVWRYPTLDSDLITPVVLRDARQIALDPDFSSSNLDADIGNKTLTKEVLRSYPEFVGADEAVSESLRVTNVNYSHKLQDHSTGPLLCSVRLYSQNGETSCLTKDYTLVVAHVRGENEDSLRIVPSQLRYPQPTFRKTTIVPYQALSHSEGCSWNVNGETVRQICFSNQRKGPSVLLAARYESSVAVFKVKLRDTVPTASRMRNADITNKTRLEMNHLATLKAPRVAEDDASFVHISFNPWKPTSMATVTSNGHWQLLEINLKEKVLDIVHEETFTSPESEKPIKGKSNTHDGWHRIFWVGDEWTVLICTGSDVEIVNLQTGFRTYERVNWADSKTIKSLDLMLRPSRPNEFFVTTTDQIHWLRLNLHKDAGDGKMVPRANLNTVLSWTHSRDRKDSTLRLSHREHPGGEKIDRCDLAFVNMASQGFYIYLYSRRSALVEIFHFSDELNISKSMAESSDVIDSVCSFPSSTFLVFGQLMKDLEFQPFAKNIARQGLPEYIHIVCLTSDSCLDEFATFGKPYLLSNDSAISGLISQVDDEIDESQRVSESQDYANKADMFVVPDEAYESGLDDIEEVQTRREVVSSVQQRAMTHGALVTRPTHPGVDMRNVYQFISRPPVVNDNALIQSLEVVFQRLEEFARNGSLSFMPLSELLPSSRVIGDIKEFTKVAQDLEDAFLQKSDMSYGFTSPAQRLGDQFGTMQYISLDSIYKSLLSDWHLPLSHKMPNQIRHAKEKLLRRVAIDLYLSSRCIMPVPAPTQTQDQPTASEQTSETPSTSHNILNPHYPYNNTTDPDPDTTSNEHSSFSSAISRLQRYATIPNTNPATTQHTSTTVRDILSHWQIGTDPSSYNYTAATAATAASRQAAAQPLNSRRARLKRRAERQLSRSATRDKRFAAADPRVTASQPQAQAQAQARFEGEQAPFSSSSQDVYSSQVGSQLGGPASSQQQPVPGGATASQVQSGRFGGRRALLPSRPGDAQTKRKSGF